MDKTPNQVLRGFAAAACKQSTDIDIAVSIIRDQLAADPVLRESMRETLELNAIREAVYDSRHLSLGNLKASHSTRGLDAITSVAGAAAASILDAWVMPDGRRLGDWTGTELLLLATMEREVSRGHAANADYFEKLSALADDQAVREAVSDKQASEIWRTINDAGAGQVRRVTPMNDARPASSNNGANGHLAVGNQEVPAASAANRSGSNGHSPNATPKPGAAVSPKSGTNGHDVLDDHQISARRSRSKRKVVAA